MVFGSGTTTPLYTPAWIPTIMLVSLIAVNTRQMIGEVKKVMPVRGKTAN
jgi:hypothetical protein